MTRRIVYAAVIGYSLVVIVIAYFAWATSLVQVVDPTTVLSLAMWFGPVGAFAAGLFAWVPKA